MPANDKIPRLDNVVWVYSYSKVLSAMQRVKLS